MILKFWLFQTILDIVTSHEHRTNSSIEINYVMNSYNEYLFKIFNALAYPVAWDIHSRSGISDNVSLYQITAQGLNLLRKRKCVAIAIFQSSQQRNWMK